MKIFTPLALLAGFALVSINAHAAVAETDTPSVTITAGTETFDNTISTVNDLIHNVTGSAIATTGPNAGQAISPGIDFPLSGINDGSASTFSDGNDTFWGTTQFNTLFGTGGTALEQDPQVTYTLNTSVNTHGYTLTSLNSVFGFTNSYSFADQDFSIQYQTVGSSAWNNLYTVAYNPFAPTGTRQYDNQQADGTSSDVALAITGVSGVDAIRFTFTPYTDPSTHIEQLGQVVRDIEVDGIATPIPEPGTWALMLAGLGYLLFLGRLRFRRNS